MTAMTPNLSRRQALLGLAGAGAFAALPGAAIAETAPRWSLGFANAPAAGFGPETLRRVRGRAPEGLAGALYRNGPAWFRYADSAVTHWFDGDGMVRRFAIQDGDVRHMARFVDTNKRRVEQAAGAAIMPGFGTPGAPTAEVRNADDVNAANTSILPVGDRVWALWEAGSPYAVDPETLDTIGPQTLRPDLAHMPFLAHPKVEPGGRIWNLGMNGAMAVVWRLSADGTVEDAQPIALPRADFVHDWAMTEKHLLIMLQPWTFAGSRPPFVDQLVWRPDEAFLILAIDKEDLSRRRVFEAPAIAFFHTGDAFEEPDGTIRVDLCASADPFWGVGAARTILQGRYEPGAYSAQVAGLALHPNGRVTVTRTGLDGEFPQIDRRRQGRRRALTAVVTRPHASQPGDAGVAVWDWERGEADVFEFGPDHMVEEMLLVPYGPRERDCWLVGTSLNLAAGATELHVLDAARVADGPLVTWRSEFAAPLGFHGAFVAA